MKNWFFLLSLVLFVVLSACGEQAVRPTLPPPTPLVDAGVDEAASPTPAVAATFTPLPPPPTLAPPPTATSPPASPTPAAVLLLSPADFGADRNPLTGELVADPGVLERRPIAVKISNAPPSYVRPQIRPQ